MQSSQGNSRSKRTAFLDGIVLLTAALCFGCAGFSETTLLQAGKTAFAGGRLPQARATFEEQLARYPHGVLSLPASTYLARIELKEGDAVGALAAIDAAIAGAPTDVVGAGTATYWRGRIALSLRRDAEALAAFSEVAASTGPSADAASYFQGRVLFRLGAYAAAVTTLRERVLRPRSSFKDGTNYWLGRALFATGDFVAARTAFAAVSPPSVWSAGTFLFTLRCDVAQELTTQGTVDSLHAFAADHPASQLGDLAAVIEGQALVELGQFSTARALLVAFPERYPGSSSGLAAAFWASRAALALGQPAVARSEASAILTARPTRNPFAPGLHVTLGEALRAEGALAQAQVELEKVVARSPTSRWIPEARYALVQVYTDLGQCSTAQANAAALPEGNRWLNLARSYLRLGGC